MGIYNIMVGDIYNYNKTGVRLGVGKKEKVITTISKALRITVPTDTNTYNILEHFCLILEQVVLILE